MFSCARVQETTTTLKHYNTISSCLIEEQGTKIGEVRRKCFTRSKTHVIASLYYRRSNPLECRLFGCMNPRRLLHFVRNDRHFGAQEMRSLIQLQHTDTPTRFKKLLIHLGQYLRKSLEQFRCKLQRTIVKRHGIFQTLFFGLARSKVVVVFPQLKIGLSIIRI